MTFAIISNFKITNAIEADQSWITKNLPAAIRIDNLFPVPGIGWAWTGLKFIAPEAPPAPPEPPAPAPSKIFTKLEFRCLFTMPELIGIDNCGTNATLPVSAKEAMLTILTNFSAVSEVDIFDARIVQGVAFIESVGLIAPGRGAEILATT